VAKVGGDRAAGELVRLYERADSIVRVQVAEAVASGALGTKRYRDQQLATIRAVLSKLQDDAIPLATQTTAASYLLGGKTVEGVMRIPEGAFTGIHQEAVELLADNLAAKLNDAAVTVGRRAEDVFRREGLRAAAEGLVTGSTRREI
jgi:hypothetical protein